MVLDEMMKNISDRVSAAAKVDTSFGEPKILNNKAIISVAIIAGGFGAGKTPSEGGQEEGSGGGGGIKVKPLAFLEVTDDETRIIPIIDYTKIILASLTLLGGSLIVMLKKKANNKKF